MKYFRKLGLVREPFSNSPDPRFLYDSQQHLFCLQQLEISVRLKRGLNVVIGDIGTGKTTLCRRFVGNMNDGNGSVHLLLDPAFSSPKAFLRVLYTMFSGRDIPESVPLWELKELVKKRLFRRGVRENELTVLIIDEGQKITPRCLEVLRELLNYETNSEKLLQIVIFAQSELEPVMQRMPNFVDRINFFCRLHPLGFRETVAMIRHRLTLAAAAEEKVPSLFSTGACYRIFKATGGYPRKIVRLCHKVVLALIIEDRKKATYSFVSNCLREEHASRPRPLSRVAGVCASLLLAAMGWFALSDIPITPAIERIMGEYTEIVDRSVLRQAVAAVPEARPLNASTRTAVPESSRKDVAGKHPELLGKVRISFSENLSGMIKNIYGVFDQKNLAGIAQANPHIADIHAVEVGTGIIFPALTFDTDALTRRLVWLEMDMTRTLSDAYAALRRLENFQVPVRILPYWAPREGLKFSVVAELPYPGAEAARAAMSDLPTPLRTEARLLSFKEGEVTFLGRLDSASRKLALADAH